MDFIEIAAHALPYVRSNILLLLIVLAPFCLLAWFRPRMLLKGAAVGAVLLAAVYVFTTFMDVTLTGVAQKERIIEKREQ